MGQMVVSFFDQLLSALQPSLTYDITPLYQNTISASSTTTMFLPISNVEIKTTLFSIPDNKAPRPDGYNAFFFKKCWSIIGADFIATTKYFFYTITFFPNSTRKDHYVWTGHPSETFTVAFAWELLRERKPTNTMHQLLWYKGCIPCQSFIMWLATLGCLSTMDKLHITRIITSNTCMLCDQHTETHEHLFFQCPYSTFVWNTVSNEAHVHCPFATWDRLLQWASTVYMKKNDITHMIARLMLSTIVYFIWHERNNRVFHNAFQLPSATVDAILQRIRIHITNIGYDRSQSGYEYYSADSILLRVRINPRVFICKIKLPLYCF